MSKRKKIQVSTNFYVELSFRISPTCQVIRCFSKTKSVRIHPQELNLLGKFIECLNDSKACENCKAKQSGKAALFGQFNKTASCPVQDQSLCRPVHQSQSELQQAYMQIINLPDRPAIIHFKQLCDYRPQQQCACLQIIRTHLPKATRMDFCKYYGSPLTFWELYSPIDETTMKRQALSLSCLCTSTRSTTNASQSPNERTDKTSSFFRQLAAKIVVINDGGKVACLAKPTLTTMGLL